MPNGLLRRKPPGAVSWPSMTYRSLSKVLHMIACTHWTKLNHSSNITRLTVLLIRSCDLFSVLNTTQRILSWWARWGIVIIAFCGHLLRRLKLHIFLFSSTAYTKMENATLEQICWTNDIGIEKERQIFLYNIPKLYSQIPCTPYTFSSTVFNRLPSAREFH